MSNKQIMWESIELLSLHDPIVRACVDIYRYGQGVTREEALMHMVVNLVQSNKDLQKVAIEAVSRAPAPFLMTANQEKGHAE